MWLTKTAISRPIFITMFVLALIVVGLQSRDKLPKEQMPRVDFPFVTVMVTYPGAGPNEIETQVTEPIEKAVSSIGGIKSVTSSSQDGVSSVGIEFELGTDLNAATADVRDKVSATKRMLPKDVEEPSILKVNFSARPILSLGLTGPLTPKDMRILADDYIRDRLSKVSGVASVNVGGGDLREISISVDKQRLNAYNLSLDQVITAIKIANLNVPAGSIREGTRDYSVRTVGEFKVAQEISDVEIFIAGKKDNPDTTIHLGDIATVKDTVQEPTSYARLNGKPTVILDVQKQTDANTVEVAEGIKEELKNLSGALPAGVKTVLADDQSTFVEESLKDVNRSLVEGVIIVVLIVFLFLHTARATFVVAVAIPTSLLATYTPMFAFGFTLNFLTLLALSLAVGILVDDSIVILENIERHIRMGESPHDAAINGRSEIGFAAVAITLVDVVVFVPIAFMGGIVGMFFRQFGITVAVATLFSLFMSFTLTPMMAARWMNSEADKEREAEDLKRRIAAGKTGPIDSLNIFFGKIFAAWERWFTSIEHEYRLLLGWSLDNRMLIFVIGATSLLIIVAMILPLMPLSNPMAGAPRLVIALITAILFAASMWRSKSKNVAIAFGGIYVLICLFIRLPLGIEFQPNVDDGRFSISVRTPPGSSLENTDGVVRRVEEILDAVPEMKDGYYITLVGSQSGSFGASSTGPQYAEIRAKAIDKTERKKKVGLQRSIADICAEISTKTAYLSGAEQISVSVGEHAGPSGGLQFAVQGSNMADLVQTANNLADIMIKVPGAIDVDVSYKEGRPERRIIVDKVKAAQMGLSVSQIAMAARNALDGDNTAKLRDGGTEYPILVRYAKKDRKYASQVEDVIVGTYDSAPIFLREVAQVKLDFAPTQIQRKDRQRAVYVSANLAKGALLGNVQSVVKGEINKMSNPAGITVNTEGSGQMMEESFMYMFQALLLAVLFVYMLMGGLFESFLTPFVIMFSLPQALVGALFALLLFGKSMSIVSIIGVIMLMGLVTKNGILMVDYTNTLRGRGKKRRDAILEAGPTRLKPILMTTCAMVGGMLPTALSQSRGAETRAPMAIDVIGGLIFSLLLTLVVIPVVYTAVDDLWMGMLKSVFPGAYRRAIEKDRRTVEEYKTSLAAKGDNWSED